MQRAKDVLINHQGALGEWLSLGVLAMVLIEPSQASPWCPISIIDVLHKKKRERVVCLFSSQPLDKQHLVRYILE
jgi:hypothetical protein